MICATPNAAMPYVKYCGQISSASPTQEKSRPVRMRREYEYLQFIKTCETQATKKVRVI